MGVRRARTSLGPTTGAQNAAPFAPSTPASPVKSAENPEDVAVFVAEMSTQLARMAKDARFDLLAQFLTMARIEAEMLARLRAKE
jgi:hypothetical protein